MDDGNESEVRGVGERRKEMPAVRKGGGVWSEKDGLDER